MKSVVVAFLVVAALGGCASAPPRVSVPADAVLTFAPPYADPEFVLQVALPRPAGWIERRNVLAAERGLSVVLRLTAITDGATLDFSFAPAESWTVPILMADLRKHVGQNGTKVLRTHAVAPDWMELLGETASRSTRTVVVKMRGMTHGILVVTLDSPSGTFGQNDLTFDRVLSTLKVTSTEPSSSEAELAQCLTEKGAKLYSAWWCGPCQEQKRLFGDGLNRLDYAECSDDGTVRERKVCVKAKLSFYPTWVFADGTRLVGTQSLDDLADYVGCPRAQKKP